jgi:hypothetical protein
MATSNFGGVFYNEVNEQRALGVPPVNHDGMLAAAVGGKQK